MGQGRGVDSYAVVVARLVGQVIVIVVEFRVFTYFFYMQISFKLKRNLGGMISTSCVNKIIQRFKYIQTVSLSLINS